MTDRLSFFVFGNRNFTEYRRETFSKSEASFSENLLPDPFSLCVIAQIQEERDKQTITVGDLQIITVSEKIRKRAKKIWLLFQQNSLFLSQGITWIGITFTVLSLTAKGRSALKFAMAALTLSTISSQWLKMRAKQAESELKKWKEDEAVFSLLDSRKICAKKGFVYAFQNHFLGKAISHSEAKEWWKETIKEWQKTFNKCQAEEGYDAILARFFQECPLTKEEYRTTFPEEARKSLIEDLTPHFEAAKRLYKEGKTRVIPWKVDLLDKLQMDERKWLQKLAANQGDLSSSSRLNFFTVQEFVNKKISAFFQEMVDLMRSNREKTFDIKKEGTFELFQISKNLMQSFFESNLLTRNMLIETIERIKFFLLFGYLDDNLYLNIWKRQAEQSLEVGSFTQEINALFQNLANR